MRRRSALLVVLALPAIANCTDNLGKTDDFDTEVPLQIYTVDGWMSLEDEYIPRVCTQENGKAAREALLAQAVAARTYVLRAMRDDPTLGTEKNPIINGQAFQAYAATANTGCRNATVATRGTVGKWSGELIVGNYVAGALVRDDGSAWKDPTKTEFFVTYNEGRSGSDVTPAPHPIANPKRSDNRGCMGQNRADWLARNGYDYTKILEYFYGADLELAQVATGGEAEKTPLDESCVDGESEQHCDETGEMLRWCNGGQWEEFDCTEKGLVCGRDPMTGDQCIPAGEGCGGVDYIGYCESDNLVYCNDGKLENIPCADEQLGCGWVSSSVGYDCMPMVEGDCALGTVEPQCVGSYFVRCRKDELVMLNCDALGMECGYADDRWDCHP